MNWTDLLTVEIETAYASTAQLLDKVDPDRLEWKPDTGSNWMTVGQLLKHITEACGASCRAFVTGDWGLPPGVRMEDLSPQEMLPPAETLPALASVAAARSLLSQDKEVALQALRQAGEDALAHRSMAAPWAPGREYPLGRHLLQMVQHLERHKAQLFYYLKLQGKPVTTADLWG